MGKRKVVDWVKMRDEEVAHGLGVLLAQKVKDTYEIKRAVEELIARGALVEEDGTGCGWRVALDGSTLLPREELVFRQKGMAWLFWIGIGKPSHARMIALADPKVEYARMEQDGPVEVGDISLVRTPVKLSLVRG